MEEQLFILEMNGYSEEEAQELLNKAFAMVEFGSNQGMIVSHLNKQGVSDLKEHVFKELTE